AIVHPTHHSHPTATKPENAYCCITASLHLWKMRTRNVDEGVRTEIMMRLAECTT
ncbi:hypothetical protein COCCADRAFT_49881, partial [Bipolaris zeicola 26-R-13]